MSKGFDSEIFKQYLDGHDYGLIPDLTEWFSNPDDEKLIQEISFTYWNKLDDGISCSQAERLLLSGVLDKIHGKINSQSNLPGERQFFRMQRFWQYFAKVAAVLFIPLLTLSSLYFIHLFQGQADADTIAMARLHSPVGSRTEFVLPDGTTGWLNSESEISFPVKFAGNSRDVHLSGEAYFNIRENKKSTFIVHIKDVKVKAYGTVFNVMAYSDSKEVEVTLVSGDVEIFREHPQGQLISLKRMIPNSHFKIDFANNRCETFLTDTLKFISWKDGKLVFRNDPLKTVVTKLERWYNVDIEITDKRLLQYTYRATFVEETFEEVMRLISMTAPINYKIISREMDTTNQYLKKRAIISYREKK